ncbi:galactose-1-phosphate uridylyltransferase [Lentilactobacillus farraginis DSM 18382 = JCM 14108]|uniref:Galactose-1-phosphate uridylyltransferase n=1 Tax=Lentilactobacillus farraginis DSM 18382 = JCM 14108 TaxID=1423743 RepID=X0PB23_9LACO|nr:galactose-1-phosphate uridylyltransferase [Lentilactobacillus farraginis DSM 18382 = JCM 14108]
MTVNQPLTFDYEAAKGKPENIRHPKGYCPFCDVDHLTNILAKEADRIWLVNKFRTLEDTFQTVVIESSDHEGGPSTYSLEQNRRVFQFAFKCWQKLISSNKYTSVIMYKNFGPLSGGSLRHPHFQIVGLNDYDVYKNVNIQNFTGVSVDKTEGRMITLSTNPIIGFVEINISINQLAEIDTLADAVHVIVKYLLKDYMGGRLSSYNLFFYRLADRFYCKIVPRFATSPYFVGYKIAQVQNHKRLVEIAAEIRARLNREA